jgi:predicted Zn-dependent protease with MMP-like domain
MPDKIIIYRKPCEEEAIEFGKGIFEVVRDIVYHEVAHYIGMSEEEVREWEKEKKKILNTGREK